MIFPVDAVISIRELQDVRVEGCLGHGVAQVEDIDVHPGIMHEEVALLPIANIDEFPARLRCPVIAGQTCKLANGSKNSFSFAIRWS